MIIHFLVLNSFEKFSKIMLSDRQIVYVMEDNLHFKVSWTSCTYESPIFFDCLFLEFYFLCRKVYALNVVGVILEELWTLTFLTNLYGFFFICLFTWVLYEFWFPSFSCKLGLNSDLEFVVHNINELKFMLDVLY
jgi:hypothetical protein